MDSVPRDVTLPSLDRLSAVTTSSTLDRETADGHFMAVRGPITLRHLRFRLTDLEGQGV